MEQKRSISRWTVAALCIPCLLAMPAGARGENRVEVTSTDCPAGDLAEFEILVTHEQLLAGLEVSVRMDQDLDFVSIEPGCGADFWYFEFIEGQGCFALGVIFFPEPVPPRVRRRLVRLQVTVPPDARPAQTFQVALQDSCPTLVPAGSIGNFLVFATPEGRLEKVSPQLSGGSVTVGPRSSAFRRGDVNTDARVDVSDPVALLDALFRGGASLSCLAAADANDDGEVDISDAVHLLLYQFGGGREPQFPGPDCCGEDLTQNGRDLACEVLCVR
jgi:hypothetical protein